MSNKEWFKSLDRAGRKHVLSILHDSRNEMVDRAGRNNSITIMEMCIREFEDIHEQCKKNE